MRQSAMFALRRMLVILLYGLIGPPLIIVVNMFVQRYNTYRDPLENWFKPIHLNIPDHCATDDPEVIYDRKINKDFENSFHTQYVSVMIDNDLGFPVCQFQSDLFKYHKKWRTRVNPKLSDLMGKKCELLSGKYRAEVTWHPRRPGYVDETVSLVSNVFEIYPSTSEKCEKGTKE